MSSWGKVIRVDSDLHKQLRILGVNEERSLSDLANEAVGDFLVKKGVVVADEDRLEEAVKEAR